VAPPPRPVVVPATNVAVAPPVVRVEPTRPVTPLAVLPATARVANPSVSITPPRDTGSSPARGLGAGFWTGLGLTVAATATAVGFYVYANSLEDDYYRIVAVFETETDPSRQSYYRALGLSYADAVDQNRLISYITGGVAGAAAVFTIGAAIYGATSPSTPRRASLQVLPSLRGDGLTLSGTF
ncbi:MAG: hypothetical protein JWM10_18, partial [Myxococcaceae bacterium]|nr:hypothetical protein [Myxococcaceae bacterium]